MNKKLIILVGVIVLLFVVVIIFSPALHKKIDWTESFNEHSTKPYGTKVFYKELFNIYNDWNVRTVYFTPYNYLSANSEYGDGDYIAEGMYMIIGNTEDMDYYSQEELLIFASEGNDVFISDYTIPQLIKDSLEIDIDIVLNNDSISKLNVKNISSEKIKIELDKSHSDSYIKNYNTNHTHLLGFVKNEDEEYPNFIKIPYYDGYFYIHLEPKAFTNYHLLKDDRYTYVDGILSLLPGTDLYFDSYTTYTTSYDSNSSRDSNLSWFLEQLQFKWAWYLAVFLLFLFMIFNAKRRQRIITTIKPLENTSIAFVNTISNLYIETNDHKNLIQKKIAYFLEKIRSDFNLETTTLDDNFVNTLVLKSGKKKEIVAQLVKYIKWLQTKEELFENNLITLNKLIEDFYKK